MEHRSCVCCKIPRYHFFTKQHSARHAGECSPFSLVGPLVNNNATMADVHLRCVRWNLWVPVNPTKTRD